MTAARAWTSSTTAVGCLLLALLLALTPGVEPRMDCESYCILTGYRYSIGPCRCYESGTRSSWHQLLSTSSYRSQDPYGVVYRGPHSVDVAMTSPWFPPVFGSPKPYYWPDSDYWFYR
ncbi:uncharacterized protein LOC144152823 [Haemaphysalis longicornis]